MIPDFVFSHFQGRWTDFGKLRTGCSGLSSCPHFHLVWKFAELSTAFGRLSPISAKAFLWLMMSTVYSTWSHASTGLLVLGSSPQSPSSPVRRIVTAIVSSPKISYSFRPLLATVTAFLVIIKTDESLLVLWIFWIFPWSSWLVITTNHFINAVWIVGFTVVVGSEKNTDAVILAVLVKRVLKRSCGLSQRPSTLSSRSWLSLLTNDLLSES